MSHKYAILSILTLIIPVISSPSQLSNPILPQFHPRQLLEWMNLGRFRLVQALLVHLTRCLSAVDVVCGFDPSSPKTTVDSSGRPQRRRVRKSHLKYSICSPTISYAQIKLNFFHQSISSQFHWLSAAVLLTPAWKPLHPPHPPLLLSWKYRLYPSTSYLLLTHLVFNTSRLTPPPTPRSVSFPCPCESAVLMSCFQKLPISRT